MEPDPDPARPGTVNEIAGGGIMIAAKKSLSWPLIPKFHCRGHAEFAVSRAKSGQLNAQLLIKRPQCK
jgi:hypothetical protein